MGESDRRQSGPGQQGGQRSKTADQEDDQRTRAADGFRPRDSGAIKVGIALAASPSVAGSPAVVRIRRTYRTNGRASRGPKIAGRSGGSGTDIRTLCGMVAAGAGLAAEALPVMVNP